MSGRRRATLLACGTLVLILLGFTPLGLKLWQEYQWRQGHARHWNALSRQFLGAAPGSQGANFFSQGAVPTDILQLYMAVREGVDAELSQRELLLERTGVSQRLIAAALVAIEARDSEALGLLGPEIGRQKHALAQAREDWQQAAGQLQSSIGDLQRVWDETWPEQALDFGLPAASLHTPPEHSREAQAAARLALDWREAQEQRLRAVAGGGEDVAVPASLPAPSRRAAKSIETYVEALKLSSELHQCFEENMAALEQDAGVDLSKVKLADIEPPRTPYLAAKVEAAQARLRLLSILNGMLNNCIETDGREASRVWQRSWPGHPLTDAPALLP